MPRNREAATIILADDEAMRCLGRYWFGVVRRPDELGQEAG